jgi:endonuclease/exonuclease/phosphatase family metal-dependent hydrolase
VKGCGPLEPEDSGRRDMDHASSDEEHDVRNIWTYGHRVGALLGLLVVLAMPAAPLWALDIVNLNLLNGISCTLPDPGDGHQCRVRDRIALLLQHIVAAGCPDLVTLEENVTQAFVPQRTAAGTLVIVGPLDDTVARIEEGLPTLAAACGFAYEVVFDPAARRGTPTLGRGIDEEIILTRYPVLASEVMLLYSPLAPFFFRHVLYARIAHPLGPLDVFTTHLAAHSDLATVACGFKDPRLPASFTAPDCPTPTCGAHDTVRECQAKQVAAFVEARHQGPEPAIIAGDFNAEPDSKEYREFTGRDWLDSHRATGHRECEVRTGENCTAGRSDKHLRDLESPTLHQHKRIDFIFVVPPRAGAPYPCVLQAPDGAEGTHSGLFAARPNPFAPTCGAAPLPICWPSDHSGNAATLHCPGPRHNLHDDSTGAGPERVIDRASGSP